MTPEPVSAERAFEEIGVEPRPGQVGMVEEVVEGLKESGRAVLDAPTGSGKSVVAVAVAVAMGERAVVSSTTNALVSQYERSFADSGLVRPVTGAGRYQCTLRSEVEGRWVSAERCYRRSPWFERFAGGPDEARHCGDCAFRRSREEKATAQVVATNFSYLAVDRMYLETAGAQVTFRDRGLVVLDEAHLLPGAYAEHCAVVMDADRSEAALRDLKALLGPESGALKAYGPAVGVVSENARRGSIGPKNAGKFVNTFMKLYGLLHSVASNAARAASEEPEHDRLRDVAEKYRRLLCKCEDFFVHWGDDCAVTVDRDKWSVTVSPVVPGEAFRSLLSKNVLLMSATADPDWLSQALGLGPTTVVRSGPLVERSAKRVVVPSTAPRVTYKSRSSQSTMGRLVELASAAARRHPGERGVALTTSFDLAERVAREVRSGHRVILHRRGESIDAKVEELRRSTVPAILLSPSLWEGVDLPGDESRFQVVLKAPYGNLSDARQTALLKRYAGSYEREAAARLVQGLGRSVRGPGDWAVSYLCDGVAVDLFESRANAWRDQFEEVKW